MLHIPSGIRVSLVFSGGPYREGASQRGVGLALGIGRAWAHLGALAALGAYVLAVGPQPSVIRAAIAGAAVSVAWPAMPLLLGLAFSAAAAAPFVPTAAVALAWVNGWVAVYIATCARVVSALPGAQVSGRGAAVAAAASIGCAGFTWRRLRRGRTARA